MKINLKEIDQSKGDAYCTFTTINGIKGHIVLHMVDGISINNKTGEMEILNFMHDHPQTFLDEFNINVTGWFSQFYELEITPGETHTIIKCKHKREEMIQ